MTGVAEANPHTRPRALDVLAATLVAAGVGLVAGVVSLLAQIPSTPWWADFLVQRHGPWVALAMGVGYLFRSRLALAAWSGTLALGGMAIGYDIASAQRRDYLSFAGVFSAENLALACLAGAVLGLAGARLADPRQHVRVTSLALLGAPWLADGVRECMAGMAALSPSGAATGMLSIGAGIVVPGLVSRSRREWRDSVPLAIVMGGVLLVLLGLRDVL